MPKPKPPLTVRLTDRERGLLSIVLRAAPLPQTDLEHLIARDDLVTKLKLRAMDKLDDVARARLDHVAQQTFLLNVFELNVLRQVVTVPGQLPAAWAISAGIARKLPPLPQSPS